MTLANILARALAYVTAAAEILFALSVAFLLDEAGGFRARFWSVRCRWQWAAEDVTTTATINGRTVTVTSTRAAAARLVHDVIGEW